MKDSSFIFSFKKACRQIIVCILVVAIIAICFLRYCDMATPMRGSMYAFYHFMEKDTLDVLCVGSSHVYCGVNPVQMYEDYGIAAYDLAAGSQSIAFSYYYLEEAFKTQHPKLVILDTYMMIAEDEQEKENAQMNLYNMKPSLTKYRALQMIDGLDNMGDIFWFFPIVHDNYANINEVSYDFKEEYMGLYLGYEYRGTIEPYDLSMIEDVRFVTEVGSVSEKKENYLRKCIELCRKNNVEIVLTNIPWPDISVETQKVYNLVQQIADEYGVEFINGCLYTEEIGLDYTVDSSGDSGHLNYTGATKYTKWLTEHLISEGYDLPDRRGDDRYGYWQRESERFTFLLEQILQLM